MPTINPSTTSLARKYKLSIFDHKQLKQMESMLYKYENNKSDLESKVKLAEKELVDTTELIPKWNKSLESILNQISAIQYTIRTE